MSENDHWLLTKEQQDKITSSQNMYDADVVMCAAEVLAVVAKCVEPDVAVHALNHACRLRAVAERLRRER